MEKFLDLYKDLYKKLFTRKNKDKNKDKQTDSDDSGYSRELRRVYAKGGHIDHGKTTLTMVIPQEFLLKKQRQG